jgi:molecular chaperone GrpE
MPWDDRVVDGSGEGASGGENRMPPDTPSPTPSADAAAGEKRLDDAAPTPPVSAERDAVASVEKERDEYLDLAKRTKAEFENFRKRVSRQAAEAEIRGRGELARDLVPVLDNLERALAAANPEEDHLADGVRLVRDELVAVLARAGVESYEPEGEAFDPDWHEAMLTRPGEAGQVLEVLEKGYRLNGQVLRPARVVVGAAEE